MGLLEDRRHQAETQKTTPQIKVIAVDELNVTFSVRATKAWLREAMPGLATIIEASVAS